MKIKDAFMFLKYVPMSENSVISRWYNSEDANQDTMLSIIEAGHEEGDITPFSLIRKRNQVFIDKIRWGSRKKRADCNSNNTLDSDTLTSEDIVTGWESSKEVDVENLITEFTSSISDPEVKLFFNNLVFPSEEIKSLWREKVRSNRIASLEFIPPYSMLKITGMSKSKYLKYRRKLIDFLKMNMES